MKERNHKPDYAFHAHHPLSSGRSYLSITRNKPETTQRIPPLCRKSTNTGESRFRQALGGGAGKRTARGSWVIALLLPYSERARREERTCRMRYLISIGSFFRCCVRLCSSVCFGRRGADRQLLFALAKNGNGQKHWRSGRTHRMGSRSDMTGCPL